ncbi:MULTISPECIES: LacI family DNA-binding transcriptional regulator [Vibrio]|uniref:LacI family DNA-binding transcriptional regulator n=1 Tax=Vibrio TaxID=662 RepID=UPI003D0C7E76
MNRKKKTTLTDIAELCGVSKATVSRVMNQSELVSDDVVRKVRAALQEHGYKRTQPKLKIPMPIRKILVLGEHDLNSPHSFFGSILKDLKQQANDLDIAIELQLRAQISHDNSAQLLTRAQAIIVLGMDDSELLTMLRATHLPVLLINGYDPMMQFSSVSPDYYLGGQLAADYLFSLGHKNIKCITANIKPTVYQRADGFKRALLENGITQPDEHIIDLAQHIVAQTINDDEITQLGTDFGAHKWIPEMISNGVFANCTAVFCICDMIAMTLIEAFRTQGIRVPDDISVLGFDDIDLAEFSTPPLTTIRTDHKRIAKVAIHTLIQAINDGGDTVTRSCVSVSLVSRQSCRQYKNSFCTSTSPS